MKSFGYLLWIGSGIVTLIFMLSSMYEWLGGLGIFVGLLVSPGVVVFPIVYWFIENVFPTLYFTVWAVGIVGLIITASSSEK